MTTAMLTVACSLGSLDYLQEDDAAQPPTATGGTTSDSTTTGGGPGASGTQVGSGALASSGGNPVGGNSTGGAAGAQGGQPGTGSEGNLGGGGTDTGCIVCELRANLVHRYSFNGTGTEVTDSIGTAHGTVVNAELSGSGTLELAGGSSDEYVDLPNGLVSTLVDATLEVWITWEGGGDFQRILDFGDTEDGQEGQQDVAGSTLYLTPAADRELRVAYRDDANSVRVYANASPELATSVMSHVAVVFTDQGGILSLYRNGSLATEQSGAPPLSQIHDINVWLGRSQFQDDPGFAGTLHEFRVYSAALSPGLIEASCAAGPDDPLSP